MTPTDIESFDTARLHADRVAERHWSELLKLWSDAQVMAMVGGVPTEERCRENLTSMHEHWIQFGFGRWAWLDRNSEHFVGLAGFRCMTVNGWPEVTIGYLLKPEFWGRGLATEMAESLLGLAFERLGMESIVAWAGPENSASRRVMEKIGMKYNRDGTYENLTHVLYEITRNEWSAARQRGGLLKSQ
jgi:[ribosomal protein S5]-alanine N-acetyltransferase